MTQRAPHPLTKLTRRMLPFADAASRDLPIGQLLRLSLFQVSVGLASVMSIKSKTTTTVVTPRPIIINNIPISLLMDAIMQSRTSAAEGAGLWLLS